MKKLIWSTRLVAIFLCSNLIGQETTLTNSESIQVFINVNVLTMEDSIPRLSQTVVIRDGVITEVAPSGTIEVPDGVNPIDGKNTHYLVPGLTDMHTHIENSEQWLSSFLISGVTNVLNLRGTPSILRLKERVKNNEVIGPNIYTSGPFIGVSGQNQDPTSISLEDIEAEVISQKKAGYDMMKIHGNFTKPVYQRLMDIAQREGIHVTGHIPRNLKFQDALEVGQLSIAHAEELIYTQFMKLDEDEVIAYAKKAGDAGVWLMPGVITFKNISIMWGRPEVIDSVLASPEAKYVHPSVKEIWAQDWYGSRAVFARRILNKRFLFHSPIVKHFHRAGVKMLLGTDAILPMIAPGPSVHDEVDELLKIGLSPYEVLKAGSHNAGKFISKFVDINEKFGQVSPGYRADLVLVKSNPLDNVSVLRKPIGVMARGIWYDQSALLEMQNKIVTASNEADSK